MNFLSTWHSVLLLPFSVIEALMAFIGSAILIFGLVAKEGSKFRNFLANALYYGVVLPVILVKSLLAIKGADTVIDKELENSARAYGLVFQVVDDEDV